MTFVILTEIFTLSVNVQFERSHILNVQRESHFLHLKVLFF